MCASAVEAEGISGVSSVLLFVVWAMQVMSPNAAQLTAAVSALINALVASKFSTTGALGLMNTISYARWGAYTHVHVWASRC